MFHSREVYGSIVSRSFFVALNFLSLSFLHASHNCSDSDLTQFILIVISKSFSLLYSFMRYM